VIFVDTSFWIAVRNRSDPHHEEAGRLYEDTRGEQLVTTNHVRGETWTYLQRKAGRRAALDYLDGLDRSRRASVRFITEDQETQALRWLRRHDEREYSFVDATSFTVMRSLRIREALAFDGGFAAAGFVELRPTQQ
jgi:predicted nucleic acid-binding protein